MGSLAEDLWLGLFGFGPWLEIFALGSLALALWIGIFGLGSSAWARGFGEQGS